MKVQRWYKSALATTAMVAMVGCGSSSSSDTPAVEDGSGPVFTTATELSVDENTVLVTTLAATDVSTPITYELTTSGADTSKFLIDAQNQLKFSVAPDFEEPGSAAETNEYDVRLSAIDAQGNRTSKSFTITVVNTEAPGFISDRLISVSENTINVTTVKVQSEGSTTPVLSMSGGEDQGLFDFDTDSGLLTFKTAPDFEDPKDVGNDNVYKVQLTATEGAESVTQDMEITILNVGSTALEIEAAVYDVIDTKLHVYFNTQIDADSAGNPAFAFSDGANITGVYEYSQGLPYELTVDGELTGFIAGTTKIKISDGGFTIDGSQVDASSLVPVSLAQTVLPEGGKSFTAGVNTVVDNDTGLEWELLNQAEQVWSSADTYCENLGDDWRLPTIDELISITDKTTAEPAVYEAFNQTYNGFYWSAQDFVSDTDYAWSVSTLLGVSRTIHKVNDQAKVRCVKGEPNDDDLFITDDTTGVIYDTKTGLIWDNSIQTQQTKDRSWADAKTYCENTNQLGGLIWRLPTIGELESIIDYNVAPRPINAVFAGTQDSDYWSSTLDANTSTNKVWTLRFSHGESDLAEKDDVNQTFVRCVSDGQ